jgi:hypothetical protein
MNPVLVTTAQAAERLGIGRRDVRKTMTKLGVSAVPVGSRGKWYWPAVEQALAEASAKRAKLRLPTRKARDPWADIFGEVNQ